MKKRSYKKVLLGLFALLLLAPSPFSPQHGGVMATMPTLSGKKKIGLGVGVAGAGAAALAYRQHRRNKKKRHELRRAMNEVKNSNGKAGCTRLERAIEKVEDSETISKSYRERAEKTYEKYCKNES